MGALTPEKQDNAVIEIKNEKKKKMWDPNISVITHCSTLCVFNNTVY